MSLTRLAQESLDEYWEDVALAFEGRQRTNSKQDGAACQLAVIAFHHSPLAEFKCPRQVRVVESLPKSPIGKILHKEMCGQV